MQNITTAPGTIPLARRARYYLGTLEEYREAKAAVAVAERLGKDAIDLRYHAAEVHARHQQARDALLVAAAAVEARERSKADADRPAQ